MRRLAADEALSAADFHGLMPPLAKDARLALAVSGGPDSMALAFLAKIWAEKRGYPLPVAFIVEHGLRDESAAEAVTVQQRLEAIGITAEILVWQHGDLASRVQSEARKARYSLLLDACHRHNITTLLFAHQREDQAETILMRLAKGTGMDGLAGIPPTNLMQGVQILRPLLTVPKQNLIATCKAARIEFVTDPSNSLDTYARGRLRRVMPLLAEEGLTIERLLDCGARATEAKQALDHFTLELLGKISVQKDVGTILMDKASLLAAPRAVALRALGFGLQAVHREEYGPSHASLSLLLDQLTQQAVMPPRTLHGCIVSQSKSNITINREVNHITESIHLHAGESVIWDGRWQVTAPELAEIYTVKALGNPPHEMLDRLAPELRHRVPQGRIRAALPALWIGNTLTTIPALLAPRLLAAAKTAAQSNFGDGLRHLGLGMSWSTPDSFTSPPPALLASGRGAVRIITLWPPTHQN